MSATPPRNPAARSAAPFARWLSVWQPGLDLQKLDLEAFFFGYHLMFVWGTGWGPQDSVQLVYKWLNSMVYARYNYSYFMVYKPTYNWGALFGYGYVADRNFTKSQSHSGIFLKSSRIDKLVSSWLGNSPLNPAPLVMSSHSYWKWP